MDLKEQHVGQYMGFWYLMNWQAAKAQTSLCIYTVSPEPSLLAHIKQIKRMSVQLCNKYQNLMSWSIYSHT